MADTVQGLPPLPPTPPPRPHRSLAGPFVLIVIGLFFLLGNLGIIAWHDLGYWFSHYWPVLLILWGVVKLIEYQQASRAGVRAPGIGGGGVVLIVFLVIAGLTASGAYRMNWDQLRDQMHIEGDGPWFGHSYSYNDQIEAEFPAGNSLRVTSQRGAINVSSSDDGKIHVTVHKRVNADRQELADRWDKSTRPQLTRSGQVVSLDANTQGAGGHWVSTDLDISLPSKASIVVSTRHGDLSILGRAGDVEASNQDGDVAVTDLKGSLTLNLEHSSARVSQVGSDVIVRGRANDVSVEDVKGSLTLDGDFMDSIKLSRIAKPISFKSSRTNMDVARLDGSLNLDSGDLEATNVSGPLRLRTRSKDIVLNGVTNDVHLVNENGAVEIRLSKLGSLEVTNSKGDIRIFVPQRAGFQVNAQARDGEIHSDFNALKISNEDEHASASGSVNGGGPRMVLNNEHGTIEIRTGGMVPQSPSAAESRESPSAPTATEN